MKICIIRFIGKIMMTIIFLWPPDNTLSLDQSSSNFLILIYDLYVGHAHVALCIVVTGCGVYSCKIFNRINDKRKVIKVKLLKRNVCEKIVLRKFNLIFH